MEPRLTTVNLCVSHGGFGGPKGQVATKGQPLYPLQASCLDGDFGHASLTPREHVISRSLVPSPHEVLQGAHADSIHWATGIAMIGVATGTSRVRVLWYRPTGMVRFFATRTCPSSLKKNAPIERSVMLADDAFCPVVAFDPKRASIAFFMSSTSAFVVADYAAETFFWFVVANGREVF